MRRAAVYLCVDRPHAREFAPPFEYGGLLPVAVYEHASGSMWQRLVRTTTSRLLRRVVTPMALCCADSGGEAEPGVAAGTPHEHFCDLAALAR